MLKAQTYRWLLDSLSIRGNPDGLRRMRRFWSLLKTCGMQKEGLTRHPRESKSSNSSGIAAEHQFYWLARARPGADGSS